MPSKKKKTPAGYVEDRREVYVEELQGATVSEIIEHFKNYLAEYDIPHTATLDIESFYEAPDNFFLVWERKEYPTERKKRLKEMRKVREKNKKLKEKKREQELRLLEELKQKYES